MNAPSLNDIRPAFAVRDAEDEKMSQVRELLVGDFIRTSEARLAALESRIRDLETGLGERLTQLQQQIERLGSDHTIERRAAFDELGQHIRDLGERVRVLSQR